jgi:hypothetical protein
VCVYSINESFAPDQHYGRAGFGQQAAEIAAYGSGSDHCDPRPALRITHKISLSIDINLSRRHTGALSYQATLSAAATTKL